MIPACALWSDDRWCALQVWAGREKFSANNLRLRGYEVFLPCCRERHQWSDRVKAVERALFPGYVFCRLGTAAAWSVIRLPGVIRIVGNAQGPLPIPTPQIEALQRIVDARLTVEAYPFLQAGQRVCVHRGPLCGTEGIVLAVKSRQRLIVSVPLLQRSVAVEMESDWLSASD